MVQQGRFERIRVLGSGTRTVTEKARVSAGASAGRVVTLVRLLPHAEADAKVRDVFLDKGRALMLLTQPAIVEALELGRARTHYLARQFVEGAPLRRLLGRARQRGAGLPLPLVCDIVIQLCATLLALRRELRKAAPQFALSSFSSTLRTLVISPDASVHWVDPFALDNPSVPRAGHGDPAGEELMALGALLYELCLGRPAPRPGEFTEFALVAPSTFRPEIPHQVDQLCAGALGFGEGRPRGVGAFADVLAEAAADLDTIDPQWQRDVLTVAEELPTESLKSLPVLPPASATPPQGLQPLSAIVTRPPSGQIGAAWTPPQSMPAAGTGSSPLGENIVVRGAGRHSRLKAIAMACVAVAGTSLLVARWAMRRPTEAAAAPEPAATLGAPTPKPTTARPGPKVEPAAPARAAAVLAPPPVAAAPVAAPTQLEAEPAPLPEIAPTPAPAPRRSQRATSARHEPTPESHVAPAVVRTAPTVPPPAPAEPAKAAALAPAPAAPAPAASPRPAEPALPTPTPSAVAPPATRPKAALLELPYSTYIASRRLSGQEPHIPPDVLSRLGQGSARARVCVGEGGQVTDVRILRATTGLDEAVRAAVQTWRYRPFLSQGRPVTVCFEMPFEFKRTP